MECDDLFLPITSKLFGGELRLNFFGVRSPAPLPYTTGVLIVDLLVPDEVPVHHGSGVHADTDVLAGHNDGRGVNLHVRPFLRPFAHNTHGELTGCATCNTETPDKSHSLST